MRAAQYYMLSFNSTHRAMEAERYLAPRLPVCAMPTLRAVTQSCGISLRVEEEDAPLLRESLSVGFPVPEGEYRLYHVTDGAPEPISNGLA